MSKDILQIHGQGNAEAVNAKGHGNTQHKINGFDLTGTVEGMVSRGIPKDVVVSGQLDFEPGPSDPDKTARELSALWGDAKRAKERRQGRPGRSHIRRGR